MNRLLTTVLAAATLILAAACGDLGSGPAGNLTGTYSLRAIDGDPVPSTLYYVNSSDNIVIQSGSLTLYGDGRYVSRARVQDTEFGSTTVYDDETNGQWTLSGSELRLVDDVDFQNTSYAYVDGNGRITIDGYGGFDAQAEFVK